MSDKSDPEVIRDLQRNVWNRTASGYADVFQGQVTQTFDPMLDAAHVEAETRLLDVATGPGILAAAAAKRGATPVGTDIADEMIEEAKRRFPGIEFQVADAAELPFPDESFDAVTISMGLFLMGEPERALRECLRVLRPGGWLAHSLLDEGRPGHALFGSAVTRFAAAADLGEPPRIGVTDHEVLSGHMTDAGFSDVTVQALPIAWELDDAAHLFDAFSPMVDLKGLAASDFQAIRDDIRTAAAPYKKGNKYHIPFPALVVSGRN
jgi:SAM-dependent methyltransferase